MQTLWIDILDWSSIGKIISLSRKISFEKIYYMNISLNFPKRFIPILEKIVKKPMTQLDGMIESEEKREGLTLFETIHQRVVKLQETWASKEYVKKRIEKFCRTHQFNPLIFSEHLKEAIYPYLFKVVELTAFAQVIEPGGHSAVFLLRKSPLQDFFKEIIGRGHLYFYTTGVCPRLKMVDRPNYIFDGELNKRYCCDPEEHVLTIAGFWLLTLANQILLSFFPGQKKAAYHNSENQKAGIGVEFIQSRVRLEAINDIYWFKGSGIDPQSVCGIEFENYDEESNRTLKNLGIRRLKILKNPLRFLRYIFSRRSKENPFQWVLPCFRDTIKIFPQILRLGLSLGEGKEKGWLSCQEIFFHFKVIYWESIYRKLGLKILWTMHDIEPDKFIKAQSLQRLRGLYMGSHWSLYQMECRGDDQKCYDIFFSWGPLFVRNIYKRYPFKRVFEVGYPLDFYFESKKEKALNLRKPYPDKFILSYHDNVVSFDLPYSKGMQIKIHQMLLELLKKYDQLVVFLKPKRFHSFKEIKEALPQINEYIQKKRIAVFLGETARIKVPPGEIGLASDLSLGLGLSTAACECFFAGGVSFHIDLAGFVNNEFEKQGLNKVVFTDIASLREAIEDRIQGKNTLSHQDYRPYYQMLDPFQDGKAYLRTGFVIKEFQEAFRSGLTREEVLQRVDQKFASFMLGRLDVKGNSVLVNDEVPNHVSI